MKPLTLIKGVPLDLPGERLLSVVFPESGLLSVVNRTQSGRQIEVGLFGRDGMGSIAVVLGGESTPFTVFAQVEGHGYSVEVGFFESLMESSKPLRQLLLRYCQAFMVQIAETAVSNGTFTIEARLARWLLLAHDRLDGDEMVLTHEFLSIMLGVRRTGVTLAIHVLEGEKTIRARRGVITMLDREKLKSIAAEGYGVAQGEYERLLGPLQ